jgi:hypothetical protein
MSSPTAKRQKLGNLETALANEIQSDESVTVKGVAVPMVIECKEGAKLDAVLAWVGVNQPALEAKLKVHGAILFRNFPFTEVRHFDDFVTSFNGWKDLSYEDSLSFAVRLQKTGRICTTNEGRTGGLVFHHEQAQSPRWPSKLFFCCELAAQPGDGGFTGVCRSDLVLEELTKAHPDFVKKCEDVGVKYTIYMGGADSTGSGVGRSWKSYFSAPDRESCEARMKDLGYTWTWQEDGVLKATTPRLEAIACVPGTTTRCFFNQLPATTNNAIEFSNVGKNDETQAEVIDPKPTQEGLNKCLSFGDGAEIGLDILLYAKALCEKHAVDLQWQSGDVALLDNYLVMHARRIWNGPLGSRKLLASLVE